MNEKTKKVGRKAIAPHEKRVRTVLYLHPSNVRPAKELTAMIEGGNFTACEIEPNEQFNVQLNELKVQLNEKQKRIDELNVLLNAREIDSKHGFSAVQEREPELRAQMDKAYGEPLQDLFDAIATHYNSGKVMKDRYITMMMQQAKSQAFNSRIPT